MEAHLIHRHPKRISTRLLQSFLQHRSMPQRPIILWNCDASPNPFVDPHVPPSLLISNAYSLILEYLSANFVFNWFSQVSY